MTYHKAVLPLAAVALLAGTAAAAQATDPAAERARLAEERIRIEAQRREQQAREAASADAATASVETGTGSSGPQASDTAPAPERMATVDGVDDPRPASTPMPVAPRTAADPDITRSLEQLRTLGELKDAGYVTDEEFERIKRRIIDAGF